MKNTLLLPHYWKVVGWIFLLPSLVLGCIYLYSGFSITSLHWELADSLLPIDFTDELIGLVLVLSLILVGFSRLRFEDEYTLKIRLDAFQLSFYIHAVLLAVAMVTIYDDAFFDFMVINLFVPLLLYVAIFQIKIMLFSRQ